MWIYDILNALYFFMLRLLELIGILLSILFIPFSIWIDCFFMNVSEIIPYSKYIINTRLNKLRTFSFTLKVSMEDAKPKVSIQHYDDDTDEVTKQINDTKFSSIRACITKAFTEARRYSFLVFQTNAYASKFIQLRMDTGFYLIDLPLTPLTLNRDYAIEFIKLLHAKGLRKIQPEKIYLPNSYSISEKKSDLTVIQANLGQDTEKAIAFCYIVLTKIFKLSSVPEVIVE